MEPIRVLQVFTILNRGGAETIMMNYYRNIDRSKVQFDFLVHRKEHGAYDGEVENLGGKIYRLSNFNPLAIVKYNNELTEFFRKHKEYKIVHAHNCTMNMYDLRAAKKNGVAVTIAHSHLAKRELDIKTPFFLYNNMRINQFSTYKFACGSKAAKWHFGKNISDVRIMKNAIDSKQFVFNSNVRDKVRQDLNIQSKFVIGHVGRFNESKNHNFLIEIFNLVYKQYDKVALVLVGEGELQRNIARKVEKLGLKDRIIFLGLRADVNEIMQAFDIFLFPSLFEALPVTVIEAQASGLPCIVSDTITKEVNITGLVRHMSLHDSLEAWATTVLGYRHGNVRHNTFDAIMEAGYDIKESAKGLTDFYLDEFKKVSDNDLVVS